MLLVLLINIFYLYKLIKHRRYENTTHTTQHNTTQRNTTQHNATQRNATQRNTSGNSNSILTFTIVFFSILIFSTQLTAQYQYIVTGRVGVPIIEGPNQSPGSSYPGTHRPVRGPDVHYWIDGTGDNSFVDFTGTKTSVWPPNNIYSRSWHHIENLPQPLEGGFANALRIRYVDAFYDQAPYEDGVSVMDWWIIENEIQNPGTMDSHRRVAADLNLDQVIDQLDKNELKGFLLNFSRPHPPRSWDFFNMHRLGTGNMNFAAFFVDSPWNSAINFPNYLDTYDDDYIVITGAYNLIGYGLCRTSSTGWKYGDLNNDNSDIYQVSTYTMDGCDYEDDPGIIDNTIYPDTPGPSSEEALDFSSHDINIIENGSPQNNFSVVVTASSAEEDVLAFQLSQLIPDGFVLDSVVFNNPFKASGATAIVDKFETGKSNDEIRVIWHSETLAPINISLNDWLFTIYGSIIGSENDFFLGHGAMVSVLYTDGYDSLAASMNLQANVMVNANRSSFDVSQIAGAIMTQSEKYMHFEFELSNAKGMILKYGDYYGTKDDHHYILTKQEYNVLPKGPYFLKVVASNDEIQTIKFIKL